MSAELPVPVFDQGGAVLYHGDCRDVLPTLEADSIESCICDPPYGLSREPDITEVLRHWLAGDDYEHNSKGFMGQSWDSFLPGPSYWKEVIRVLKPGGHALIFGGTRTADLLTIALRLAGFEIRDRIGCFGWEFASLSWIFGSSIPKGINISIAIDQMEYDRREREIRAALAGLGYADVRWAEEAKGGGDEFQPVPVLLCVEVEVDGRAVAVERLADGTFRRPGYLREAEREVVGSKFGLPGYRTGPTGENEIYGAGLANGDAKCTITAPATDAARQWSGWASQLKSMYEPIILARKPLVGSVVENVLKWGTGGLNVGACRIGLAGEEPPTGSGDMRGRNTYAQDEWTKTSMCNGGNVTPASGRYPTNCLYAHHPLCVPCGERRVKSHNPDNKTLVGDDTTPNIYAGGWGVRSAVGHADADGMETVQDYDCHEQCPIRRLDEMAGERKSGAVTRSETATAAAGQHGIYGEFKGKPDGAHFPASEGPPSRFFPCFTWDASDFVPLRYVSKSSRTERESGLLGHIPCATCGGLHSREHRNDQGGMVACVRNIHPTIKPCSLLQWMCKLLCPPGGTILDSFAGTASVGRAAILEGFRYIGIEREPSAPDGPDYIAIATARLADALLDRERPNRPKPKARPRPRGKGKGAGVDRPVQASLFDAMGQEPEQ